MKILVVIMLVTGLFLGPAYVSYCWFFSGKSMGAHTVFEQDVAHVRAMGMSVTPHKNAKWKMPLVLDLRPDMNPINLNASARYARPGVTWESTQYVASLKKDGNLLWEEPFSISVRPDEHDRKSISVGTSMHKATTAIKTFSIGEAGKYELNISQKGSNDIIVSRLSVGVRRNVSSPHAAVAIPGFLLLIAGAVIGFVGLRAKYGEGTRRDRRKTLALQSPRPGRRPRRRR